MKLNLTAVLRCLSLLPLCVAVNAQVIAANEAAPQGPVSYSSVNQLNSLLSQLEQASQAAQLDLAKLRVEKWKTDSGRKRQAQGNVESIQRNLQTALPEIISELRTSPESLTSTFKLYRNLDALYDVFESVAESTGAFGSKDEFQSLENDVSAFEKERRSVAERMEAWPEQKKTKSRGCARHYKPLKRIRRWRHPRRLLSTTPHRQRNRPEEKGGTQTQSECDQSSGKSGCSNASPEVRAPDSEFKFPLAANLRHFTRELPKNRTFLSTLLATPNILTYTLTPLELYLPRRGLYI